MRNKRILLLAAYTAVLFLTAPQILGNAIITGKAMVVYLVISLLTLLAFEFYDKRKTAGAVSN